MACQTMPQFIKTNLFDKFYQDVQSSRISQDLADAQAVMNLLKAIKVTSIE